ncbi:hypothetical protein Pla123a_22820 [Posidoniimonas polymericola]|uniref:Right handed beta helix domain-containing protein n=1 Tax=Posidoniimonas polymericola TaxID=2528002 RepID=A0A5C5YPV4_9BACT|nr:right-handed parallel beta-helix repeat-containing protein [Posidoniimonas polymericola]TWT76859.1 hypothetical protein Pla123a_22820 [Posidoniimonas polymericola]
MKRLLRVACWAVALLPALSSGRDIYVNNLAGDDRLSGLNQELSGDHGPVASICRALKIAAAGDHVIVANTGELYREQLSVFGCNLRGYEDRPLTISGNGATLDGTVMAADGSWRHVDGDVFAMSPRRLTFQQLFKAGSPLARVRVASATDADQALQPLQWAMTQNEILLRVDRGRLPEQYELRHAGMQTGITLYNTRHVVVEDFVVQGFQQDGVNAHTLVNDCVLRRIECRANGRSGLSVGGASRVLVEESGFYDNGRAQVRVEGHAKLTLDGCELDDDQDAAPYLLQRGDLTIDGERLQSR